MEGRNNQIYQNFFNLLAYGSVSKNSLRLGENHDSFLLRSFSLRAAWNDGIVECWKTGYEKRKKIYYKKIWLIHQNLRPIIVQKNGEAQHV